MRPRLPQTCSRWFGWIGGSGVYSRVMGLLRRGNRGIDLLTLPPDVRHAVEDAMTGGSITVRRGARELGTLDFRPAVLEGTVVVSQPLPPPETTYPDGVTVVATAMSLSERARRRLADEMGPDYVVLDFLDAPASADVLLINAVSPTLLGRMQARFPQARVIVTEIDDEETGAHFAGPVSRLLDAGAAAYLPPRDLGGLAANVHAYLTGGGRQALTSARSEPVRELGARWHEPSS